MPLSRADYEKHLGMVPGTMTDALYAKLTSLDGAKERAPGAYAGATSTRGADGGAPSKSEELARTAALASPAFTYNTPNGPVRLWSKNPAEVDAYVQAGQIDPDTAASIKAHLATQGPQPMAAEMSGKQQVSATAPLTYKSKSAVGDEMSAAQTGYESAKKKGEKEIENVNPLGALVSKAPAPVLDKKAPTQGKGPGTPLFQAATAPAPVPPPISYDMGTTNVPATFANKVAPPDKYATIPGGDGAPTRTYNESTLGMTAGASYPANPYAAGMTAAPNYAPPAGLVALDESLKKSKKGK